MAWDGWAWPWVLWRWPACHRQAGAQTGQFAGVNRAAIARMRGRRGAGVASAACQMRLILIARFFAVYPFFGVLLYGMSCGGHTLPTDNTGAFSRSDAFKPAAGYPCSGASGRFPYPVERLLCR